VHCDHGDSRRFGGTGQADRVLLAGAQAATTASTISTASGSSFIRAEPAHLLQTFLAGQPMLMSMIWAPRSTL